MASTRPHWTAPEGTVRRSESWLAFVRDLKPPHAPIGVRWCCTRHARTAYGHRFPLAARDHCLSLLRLHELRAHVRRRMPGL